MKKQGQKFRNLTLGVILAGGSLFLASGVTSNSAIAHGPTGEHVNDLQGHLSQYGEEVNWLLGKFGDLVDRYENKGKKGVKSDALLEYWEEVDFHAAIETQYVPIYAAIWQGIYGVKQAVDEGAPVATVRGEQAKLEQALWQALGAVKLAAQYQQKGLLPQTEIADSGPTSAPETLEEIKHRLDQVVAKYAEKLPEAATTIVHDTYLHRFEGVEGGLIALDAALVEDLEKDFNVTLPQALSRGLSVDDVRKIVSDMQTKLDRAKALLEKAEKGKREVF